MKKVFIKYNPYKIETQFTVDGESLRDNSEIGRRLVDDGENETSGNGVRLQEWVEELPQLLIEEYNDNEFEITFHGTQLDYEDLDQVIMQSVKKGELKAKLNHIPAKETSDKEVLLEQVFSKIKQGPFEELRGDELVDSFEQARCRDYKVCVIATMSAGKSTLINALLRTQLMPSEQGACTAKITEIKDNDRPVWKAKAKNEKGKLIETHEELSYLKMVELNKNEKISKVEITGNIPFVTAEDVSLILVDTPGRNNSETEAHRKLQGEYLEKTSKTLVLYIMEGTFGSDDDNAQLKDLAESMSVKGKQSKDRFLFLINKMDARNAEDGRTEDLLEKVRKYLQRHGIKNPNLFPVAALPALNIRRFQNGEKLDEDTLDAIEFAVKKMNRSEDRYLEDFASLPASIRKKIKEELKEAESEGNTQTQALIHTGIRSVEEAIRQYVQKYAKTDKIKNVVDTFTKTLESAQCEAETDKELASRIKERDKIIEKIEKIKQSIKNLENAREFQNKVADAVKKVNNESLAIIKVIIGQFQSEIRARITSNRQKEIPVDKVEMEVQSLKEFEKALELKFRNKLEELIQDNLVRVCKQLVEDYRSRLASLTEKLDDGLMDGVSIEPLKLMEGKIATLSREEIGRLVHSKDVEDGEEWVENSNKKWYKPWTWFEEDGYYRKKYAKVEYIAADELAQSYLNPVQDVILENGKNAQKAAEEKSMEIAERFNQEFEKLDKLLTKKLDEKVNYLSDEKQAKAKVEEAKSKLAWLKKIKDEMEDILEI